MGPWTPIWWGLGPPFGGAVDPHLVGPWTPIWWGHGFPWWGLDPLSILAIRDNNPVLFVRILGVFFSPAVHLVFVFFLSFFLRSKPLKKVYRFMINSFFYDSYYAKYVAFHKKTK